ncbi:hypothetical protein ACSSV4_002178 [Roseovarius sp. MBR-154]
MILTMFLWTGDVECRLIGPTALHAQQGATRDTSWLDFCAATRSHGRDRMERGLRSADGHLHLSHS